MLTSQIILSWGSFHFFISYSKETITLVREYFLCLGKHFLSQFGYFLFGDFSLLSSFLPSFCLYQLSQKRIMAEQTWLIWHKKLLGGSSGLVVMGGDSCSEGHQFESQHCILNGHFSHVFVVKIVTFVWKDENKLKKRLGMANLETHS